MGKIIGIDLGTTNSCVAVFEGNEPVVLSLIHICEVAIACMMFVGNQVFIHYLKEDGVAAVSYTHLIVIFLFVIILFRRPPQWQTPIKRQTLCQIVQSSRRFILVAVYVPGRKPGTSSKVIRGILKQSQKRIKRAALSLASMSRTPASQAG